MAKNTPRRLFATKPEISKVSKRTTRSTVDDKLAAKGFALLSPAYDSAADPMLGSLDIIFKNNYII